MLYFLTSTRYTQIDKYNIIYILDKRLIDIIPLWLIYDSIFSTKDVTIITGVKDYLSADSFTCKIIKTAYMINHTCSIFLSSCFNKSYNVLTKVKE